MQTLKLRTGTILRDVGLDLLIGIDAQNPLYGYNCVSFQHTIESPHEIVARLNASEGWFSISDLRPTLHQGRNLHFAAMDFGLAYDWNSPGIRGSGDVVAKADSFAFMAHRGQTRKHSGEPYIIHPRAVAQFLIGAGCRDATVLAGALLHDVVEDTSVTIGDIRREFGDNIARVVHQCTMVSKKSDGNRAVRKNIDLEHYASGDKEAQTIKLADFIHNAPNLFVTEPTFFPTFIEEKSLLVSRLDRADSIVRECAQLTVDFYKKAMLP